MTNEYIQTALEWCKSENAPKDRLRKPRQSPHYVYFFADETGAAQYVGMTANMQRRLSEHKRDRNWWSDDLELMFFEVPTRSYAHRMELALIKAMKPKYNVQGNNLCDVEENAD